MKHTIVYKNKLKYSSFPLLTKLDDRILIGFFVAPMPDHMGIFKWVVWESFDQGETWQHHNNSHYDWPSISPREQSDRFAYELNGQNIVTGSYGFKIWHGFKSKNKIIKSKHLFIRSSDDNWKTIDQRFYEIPTADIALTFPRALVPKDSMYHLKLIPAYIVLKNRQNRAMVWRSQDYGLTWRLYNMFPDECSINEMAFIQTKNGILAHLRSDEHSYLMESWSQDGIIWSYPTSVFVKTKIRSENVVGGPPHLLRLNDNRILCTYGYRFDPMGIRAIISDNEGDTWSKPIILRDDGGFLSSLYKRKLRNRFRLPSPANDIGYPVSIQLDNDEILTAYYITCKNQITGIETTKWGI